MTEESSPEPPLEPASRILGQGTPARIVAQADQEDRTFVWKSPAESALTIQVRMAALQAAVDGGGISETPQKTITVAEEYEKWIMRGISE